MRFQRARRVDVLEELGIIEELGADEVFAIELMPGVQQQVFVECLQRPALGRDAGLVVAVVGPHEGVTVVTCVLLEGLVAHCESE